MSEVAVTRFPCKDCEDRFVGCHSICDIYNRARLENDKLREKKKMQNKPVRSDFYFDKKSKRASSTVVNVFRGGRQNDN